MDQETETEYLAVAITTWNPPAITAILNHHAAEGYTLLSTIAPTRDDEELRLTPMFVVIFTRQVRVGTRAVPIIAEKADTRMHLVMPGGAP